jgi:hypothetical protein
MTSAERDYLDTKKEIMRFQNDRVKLLRSFKPGHPDIVVLDEKIESAKQLLSSFADEIVRVVMILNRVTRRSSRWSRNGFSWGSKPLSAPGRRAACSLKLKSFLNTVWSMVGSDGSEGAQSSVDFANGKARMRGPLIALPELCYRKIVIFAPASALEMVVGGDTSMTGS